MEMKRPLKFWIIAVTTFSMLVTLVAIFATSYYVNRQSMTKIVLDENQANAKKVGALTNDTFGMMQDALRSQHQNVINNWSNDKELGSIVRNIQQSNYNFNSVTVLNEKGVVKSSSPDLNLLGKRVNTPGVKEALRLKDDFISAPYIGVKDKMMMIVSTAIYEDGKYLGMVNGLVWLREKNFLTRLLEETYGNKKNDLVVFDQRGTYIYNKNKNLIGKPANKEYVLESIQDGVGGSRIIHDKEGNRSLAGFTKVEKSKWGIVSMTPEKIALEPAKDTMYQALLIAVPSVFLALLILFGLISFIAKPLNRLSNLNHQKPIHEFIQEVRSFSSPYEEAGKIRQMLLLFAENQQNLVTKLENMAVTDPMTGLANRRRLNDLVEMIKENKEPFGYVLLDIDRFKKVNDTYGHLTGDRVLIQLADLMRSITPEPALPIRIGGEEFAVILQETSAEGVLAFAERLRRAVEKTDFPIPERVTVSIGAGYLDCEKCDLSVFYNEVDQQLYKAKQTGRNRVESVFIVKGKRHIS